eukprot:TRINITY_DN1817_c0_g1_i1.p1 TRINITY_DN1817_c0_g1~~TRINITY_DN1817_c0_g1_i1.p1  ORF type:complete len:108 (+),score=32.07 TRINITY_DN1817_c0_g1_i1:87-410(+)
MARTTSRAMSCNPELKTGYVSRRFPSRVMTTRAQDKERDHDIANRKYALPNETGSIPLHTAWYITDRGDKVWLRFDPSRPCYKFPTTETRFYKPKLHKIVLDPYQKK